MFWGEVIKNDDVIRLKGNSQTLRISHAALVKRGEKNKILLQLSDNKKKYVIGILSANVNEFISLDFNITFDKTNHYSLSLVNGQGTEVHVTGYYTNLEKANREENNNIGEVNDSEVIANGNGNEEVDGNVDIAKLDTFLRRKIGKNKESNEKNNNIGKKLKKLKQLHKPCKGVKQSLKKDLKKSKD